MVEVGSWGRTGTFAHEVRVLNDRTNPLSPNAVGRTGLPYGMARSYGDICLNPGGLLWMTTGLDRFIAFSPETGMLRCEGGVILRDIQQLCMRYGWMLPVTPGTQLITVGGAIANDIHGKNHHGFGSFCDHVRRLTLVRTDGTTYSCGPDHDAQWFKATCGGMGLTGLITEAELQLRPVRGPWLDTETLAYTGLDEFFHLADSSEAGWEHTVAWIDCLSGPAVRGLFMRANPVDAGQRPAPSRRKLSVPCVPPLSLVNRMTLRPFNLAYFHLKAARAGKAIAHYEPFLHPLDTISDWNRIYGPKGFFQYQSVIPRHTGPEATKAMLAEIARSGMGSFLAVLKTFGNRTSPGLMSFPQPGVTLALDFPNTGASVHMLFERLDAIVREAKGRIYPAKDARMPRDLFESGYPNLHNFLKYRDPGISSALSRRLMGY